MDLCVFGAGAVGSLLAGHLKLVGKHTVSIVARGPHLEAIRANGLEMVMPDRSHRIRFDAAESRAALLPPQDIVFVTLKAHSVPAVAEDLAGLLKPDGYVVFISNGIPWWWNLGREGGSGQPMRVDPEGRLERAVGHGRTIGGVVYSANEVVEPGKIIHAANNHWMLGETDNRITDRLERTAQILREAGLNGEAVSDLRGIIWNKLLRNTVFNALTGLTRIIVTEMAEVPSLVALAQTLTSEVVAVANAAGWPLPPSDASSIISKGGAVDGTKRPRQPIPGDHSGRSSMHQDVLAGRPLEIDPIVGHVQQIAREFGVPTPTLDTIYALLQGLNHGIKIGG